MLSFGIIVLFRHKTEEGFRNPASAQWINSRYPPTRFFCLCEDTGKTKTSNDSSFSDKRITGRDFPPGLFSYGTYAVQMSHFSYDLLNVAPLLGASPTIWGEQVFVFYPKRVERLLRFLDHGAYFLGLLFG